MLFERNVIFITMLFSVIYCNFMYTNARRGEKFASLPASVKRSFEFLLRYNKNQHSLRVLVNFFAIVQAPGASKLKMYHNLRLFRQRAFCIARYSRLAMVKDIAKDNDST